MARDTTSLVALIRARMAGLTRNTTRLVAMLISAALLVVLFGISKAKWSFYLQRYEGSYSESVDENPQLPEQESPTAPEEEQAEE